MGNISIFFGIIISIAFFVFAYSLYTRFTKKKSSKENKKDTSEKIPSGVNCPLCGSILMKGENLSSRIFRPIKTGTDEDQRCTILGCPHCLPYCQNGIKRTCPVCKKNVPLDGYLIARLFTYKTGKRHVRITACTECSKKQ